jgi:hypothetical protein
VTGAGQVGGSSRPVVIRCRLRWTTKSTVKLADELTAQGHRVGPDTVARLLKDHGYSLQGNAKTIEGKQHPDRDAQFRYLNDQLTVFLAAGLPVTRRE